MIRSFGEDSKEIGEIESSKLVIFLLTFRNENFTSVAINITLSRTNINQYYTVSNFTDANCVIGKEDFYEFQYEDFTDASYELFKFKYIEKYYPETLCPLSLYNTGLTLVNDGNSSENFKFDFETGLNLYYFVKK